MTPTTCTHCDRPVHARALCKRHYRRWSDYGDPLKGTPVPDAHAMPDGWYAPSPTKRTPPPSQGLRIGATMLGQIGQTTDDQAALARRACIAEAAGDEAVLADLLGYFFGASA